MVNEIMNLQSLKQWFEDTGIKQSFMAKKWGITPSHLSQIILLKTTPGPKLARTISHDTGIPLETLLFPDEQTSEVA